MKNALKKIILSIISFAFLTGNAALPYKKLSSCHLKVTVHNIRSGQGRIRVAIYNNSSSFLDSKKFYSIQAVPTNGQGSVTLDFALPYGDYAITAYHDLNENKNLDRSAVGVPAEPYSLSNGVMVKWRKPSFSECKIPLNQTNQQVSLTLRLWADM